MTFFEELYQATQAAKKAQDTSGRILYPILAIVCEHLPDGKICVVDPVNPAIKSYPIARIVDQPYVDAPYPPIGSTVLCFFVDGLFSEGFYASIVNATNPRLHKNYVDFSQVAPNNYALQVDKNYLLNTEETISITIQNSLTVTITDSGISINLEGGSLTLSNVGSASINGKQIATIGAVDSDGDILLTRGW